jgi:hypothetical protein
MKGATAFDKWCHRVFESCGGGKDYFERETLAHCERCGNPLYAYYCEDRLFFVECKFCEKKALVKANNRDDAARKAFGKGGDENAAD